MSEEYEILPTVLVIHPSGYTEFLDADLSSMTSREIESLIYGENLENIEYGDPYQYRTIFKKYIYLPMYEHFNDPANREMILSLYPDFPFDFPNPF